MSGCWRCGDDVDGALALRPFDGKLDLSIDESKERVILADTDIDTRVEGCAALPHDDVAGQHLFAAVTLDAETF